MSQTRIPRRLLAGLTCATALIACDDPPLAPGSTPTCTELSASPNPATASLAAGQARIRVNLVSRLGAPRTSGEGVNTSGVEVYNNTTCYRIAASALTRLGSVENDMGGLIADAVLELPQITHIMLQPSERQQGARTFVTEKIALAQPIELEEGTRTEIFLALDSVSGTQNVATRFVAAGTVPFNAGVVMAFEPGRDATASTSDGFAMTLPGGSASQPGVYGIVAHDVGEVGPMVDIMPGGTLTGSARLTVPIDRTRIPEGLSMSDYTARVRGASATSTVDGNVVSIEADAIGLTTVATGQPYVELPNGRRFVMPGSAGPISARRSAPRARPGFVAPQQQETDQCYYNLVANRDGYLDLVRTYQFVRSTACMSVPPYVHIIFINIGRGLTAGQIYPYVLLPATWYTGTTTFDLKTIMEHYTALGTYASVNGFLWDGGAGDGPNQTGTPRGTLYIDGAQRSPIYTGAEAIIGFQQSSNSLGTPASLFDKPSGTVNLGAYTWNAVPSTTSIIKFGACSRSPTDADRKSWSAIGIGNGLLILVSSLSGEETTAYELCTVFEAMNAMDGAIRMDGGPSTAIQWNTTHLNPLVFPYSVGYGSARRIPYTVGAIQ